jgi:hypothetical protein
LRTIAAFIFAPLLLCALSAAQLPTSGDVFIGYSYSRAQVFALGSSSSINANGWEGSVEGKFSPWLAVVGDFDWHYGGRDFTGCTSLPCTPHTFPVNASRHDLLFGPRASTRLGRYTVFAEFLLGIAHQTNSGGGLSVADTSFATGVGGGVDYKLLKGVAARIQADSIHESVFGKGANNFRLSTGFVFSF